MQGTPQMPWSIWLRINIKALIKAVPLALVIGVESRDMYNRGTWDVTRIAPSQYETGDVLLICNRWYSLGPIKTTFKKNEKNSTFWDNYGPSGLPPWRVIGGIVYSLLIKTVLKTSWDDVAVIIKRDGVPFVLFTEYSTRRVRLVPLNIFLDERMPRGVALRKLRTDASHSPLPEVTEQFLQYIVPLDLEEGHCSSNERKKVIKDVQPWKQFSAAWRSAREQKIYDFNIELSRFERTLVESSNPEKYSNGHVTTGSSYFYNSLTNDSRKSILDSILPSSLNKIHTRHTGAALTAGSEKLEDLVSYQKELAKGYPQVSSFYLQPGSLVASFLATHAFLNNQVPSPARYVVADYCYDMPTKNGYLDDPIVVFKS